MINLKLAYRISRRNKTNTLISLLGMSLGFTCFILVMLYLNYEHSFDAFHHDAERLYRIVENRVEDGEARTVAAVGPQVGLQAAAQLPEISGMTQLMHIGRFTLGNDLALRDYEELYVADTNFFRMFSFPLIKGDPVTSIDNASGIVLSESLARKHFEGGIPQIGDSLWNNVYTAEVTGVFEDLPQQSHLDIDMILPINVVLANFDGWRDWMMSSWEDNSFNTYVKLREGAGPEEVSQKLTALVREHYPENLLESNFYLQPVTGIHFSDQGMEGSLASHTGEMFYVNLLTALGILVLVVAAFNYTNINTVSALRRTREIGLRKTVGAGKYQVIRQFLTESVIMIVLSLLMAVFLSDILLDYFNELMGTAITFDLFQWSVAGLIGGVACLVVIISSAYPAWVVNNVLPAEALRGRFAGKSAGFSLRKVLVSAQFAVAILMIISSMVVMQQLQYLRQIDLGYSRENRLVIDINSGNLRGKYAEIKNEMNQVSGVQSVSVSSRVPAEWKISPLAGVRDATGLEATMRYVAVDEDFISTFDIELQQGANFTGSNSDSLSVLLNEEAVRQLNLSDPVGERLEVVSVNWGGDAADLENPFTVQVKGVVTDFYFESFREEIRPMMLIYHKNPVHNIDYFTVCITGGDHENILASMKEINARFDPQNPLEYHYLDAQFNRFLASDEQRARIFGFFSVIVILISCMGLFALASFEIRNRMKEVGIRKVMGASIHQIVGLFARNFSMLIIAGFLIAAPVGWWITDRWLSDFAYQFDFHPLLLFIPGTLVFLTGMLTIGYITYRAASRNPVNVIRTDN